MNKTYNNEQQPPIIASSSTADTVQATWTDVAQATTQRALYRALQAHQDALGVHLFVVTALLARFTTGDPGSDPVPHPTTPAPWDN
ncbi:MAG: hypothetical protein JNN28_12515 [Saprospiraceae bacterium]|nr:hypothetical protein [Saprospiraceae bacterium]